MRNLLKGFKTEINPTEEQKVKIRKTIGTCRFIYNFYLAHNKELHESGKKFMSSGQFRVWLNNEFLPSHPEYSWIKEAYSKSVTQAVNNGQTAFKRFFDHKSAFAKDTESRFRHLAGYASKKKDIFPQQNMNT